MSWSTPLTAVSNAPLTASQWNASVRDNLLETAPAKATQSGSYFVGTGPNALTERVAASSSDASSDTTTSTTYGDLTGGSGPGVTATTGTRALVFVNAQIANNTVNGSGFAVAEVSGATTVSASDNFALRFTAAITGQTCTASLVMYYSLTAGSNIFTMRYRTTSGTTSTFGLRRITVLPF